MVPMIRLETMNLRKSFSSGEVLGGVSLRAEKGDVITLLGASGSGKSTLLRCINLLENPTEGRIFVGGEEIRLQRGRRGDLESADSGQLQRLRTKVGMVFQNFNLWSHMTAIENVMEGPRHVLRISKQEALARAEAFIARVGLHEKRHDYPSRLSGGQQQRVAIARALAMEPDVLLFDEPTSSLDPELVGDVLRVIRQLAAEGRTMVIATHEMDFAKEVSNRSIFLHAGVIEEQGPTAELFANPKSQRLSSFLSRSRGAKEGHRRE